MISAGIDVGTRTAKVVVLGEKGLLASQIQPVKDTVDRVARSMLKSAGKSAGLKRRRITAVAATGYGRKNVKIADLESPDSLCTAKALHYLDPEIKTAIDVGGLITRVTLIGDQGQVLDYLENERCASGSGRFLEMIAEALEFPLEEIGPLSLQAKHPLRLTSQCVVFGESEVISHLNAGEEPADILAGLHSSIAERVASIAKRVGFTPPAAVIGGLAKNQGFMHFLEESLGQPLQPLPHDPQVIGALGAAIIARQGK